MAQGKIIKMKKPKCIHCGSTRNVKFYIIADDLEYSKPICDKCRDKIFLKSMIYENEKAEKQD